LSPPRLPPALLALTPGVLDRAGLEALPAAVAAAHSAGLRGVLLREPRLGDAAVLELAERLRALLGAEGWLGLHDRPHLAAAAGADAVHLGGRSLRPEQVRPWLAPGLALGLSTHAGDAPPAPGLADYALHAPVRAVPGKGPALGLEGLARDAARMGLPLWGLGGIGPEHAAAVIAAGARGVAVLRGILGTDDPAAATSAYLEALRG
jgi:thiamine-phosphate pyrophosphorylase